MSTTNSENKARRGVTDFSDDASSTEQLPENPDSWELVVRETIHPTTDNETLIHFLKCNVGTGILAMPEAFMNSGLWVGLAGIPIMGAICVHCMFRLVHCSRELCRRKRVPALSFEETGRAACEFGPEGAKKFANVMYYLIRSFLCLTQLGFCCVYFVFIAQNLKQAVDSMITTGVSDLGFMAASILPVLLVCFVPNLKYLAPFSLIAGVVQSAGLVIILYYSVRNLPEVTEQVPWFNSWETLPLYFGSAIYAFEGIGLVLPLENKMKHPGHLLGYNGVLATATLIVICLYASIGFYGYLYYGNSVLGSISLNLPQDEGLAQAVKITMAIAVYLTYPLQIYVVFEMFQPIIDCRFNTYASKIIVDYSARSVIILITWDEMFTDSYKYEVVDDAFYMVIGKNTTVTQGDIQLEGANPSAEEEDEGTESNSVSGIDVVIFMRLQETGFGNKKDYLTYMKEYIKNLKSKLEGTPAADKLPAIQKPLAELLKKFKDLQFFTGESMNPDGMVAIGDYKEIDGEERPVIYFPKLGLEEEKL